LFFHQNSGNLVPRKLPESQFLSGYLRFLSEREEAIWESIMGRILSDDALVHLVGEFVWLSGVNDAVLIQMVQALKVGRMSAEDFRSLAYIGTPEKIKTEYLIEGIDGLLEKHDKKGTGIVLEITHWRYCNEKRLAALPEKTVLRVLTDQTIFENLSDGNGDWYWQEIAKQYIKRNPKEILQFFKVVIEKLRDVKHRLLGIRSGLHSVLADIISTDPKQCWLIVSSVHDEADNGLGYGIEELLEPGASFEKDELFGLISLFPAECVLEWISKNPEERAPMIARMAPKTLDPETSRGRLTRELLAQYGDMKSVSNELLAHFHTGGWSGPASEHYRRKRDTARSWLEKENSQKARAWIERYINGLTQEIERAEIEEERRY
jgi:hypothetical protein